MEQPPQQPRHDDPLSRYPQTDRPFASLADLMREAAHPRKPRFDGTVTLGNVLTALAMMGGLWLFFTKVEIRSTQMDSRIAFLESSQRDIRDALNKLSDTQSQSSRAIERMTTAIEYMTRGEVQRQREPTAPR